MQGESEMLLHEERRKESKFKEALALGVQVDTKWLASIILLGALHAGITYQQFMFMKESIIELKSAVAILTTQSNANALRLGELAGQNVFMSERQSNSDRVLTDHETRLRILERRR